MDIATILDHFTPPLPPLVARLNKYYPVRGCGVEGYEPFINSALRLMTHFHTQRAEGTLCTGSLAHPMPNRRSPYTKGGYSYMSCSVLQTFSKIKAARGAFLTQAPKH